MVEVGVAREAGGTVVGGQLLTSVAAGKGCPRTGRGAQLRLQPGVRTYAARPCRCWVAEATSVYAAGLEPLCAHQAAAP